MIVIYWMVDKQIKKKIKETEKKKSQEKHSCHLFLRSQTKSWK